MIRSGFVRLVAFVERRLQPVPASDDVDLSPEAARFEAAIAQADSERPPTPGSVASTRDLLDRISRLETDLAAVETAFVRLAAITSPAHERPSRRVVTREEGAAIGCRSPGCSRPHRARGYCAPHYEQWRRSTLRPHRDGTRDLTSRDDEGRLAQAIAHAQGSGVEAEVQGATDPLAQKSDANT